MWRLSRGCKMPDYAYYNVYKKRWFTVNHFTSSITIGHTTPIGRVYLHLLEIPTDDSIIDAISWNNTTTATGNVRVGLYQETTLDTAQGAILLVESASTAIVAQNGSNGNQLITLTPTKLNRGRYYVALQFDNIASQFFRGSNTVLVDNWATFYDRAGGYGAFTTPCPAVTIHGISASPRVRCVI